MSGKPHTAWVQAYIKAWNSNDSDDIGALFAEDAKYFTEPYEAPWEGRDQIVKEWLDRKDEPDDTEFNFEVIASSGDIGIVKGHTHYKSSGRNYWNLWEVRLDDAGLCKEFVEWWMKH
jgi:ketosteroid isomerase-like protein